MRKRLAFGALLAATLAAGSASADLITFDAQGLTGPSTTPPATAANVNVNTSIGVVTFSGGAILTKTTNLPANQTSVYYDSYFLSGTHTNSMTITFPKAITNFVMDLYNGWTSADKFTISDNLGHSITTPSVGSNYSGGYIPVLAGALGSVITITTSNPNYDFVIDNVQFNEGTTLGGVPEVSTWAMMALGFAGLSLAGHRASRKTALSAA